MSDIRLHPPGRSTRSGSADWRDQAACRDIDPELFFPIGNAGPALVQIGQAKQVCGQCPVRVPCLEWALESGQEAGVWGGPAKASGGLCGTSGCARPASAPMPNAPAAPDDPARNGTWRTTHLFIW